MTTTKKIKTGHYDVMHNGVATGWEIARDGNAWNLIDFDGCIIGPFKTKRAALDNTTFDWN